MCVWTVMADSFDFDDSEIMERLYQNYPVERFLNAKQSMGLSACKGMGKTFLLKAKRMQMQLDPARISGILLLPKNQLVDTPSPYILDRTHRRFLESYHNWVGLWIGCISIYLLSQEEIRSIVTQEDLIDLNDTTKELINSPNTGVYNVLGKILAKHSQKKLRDVVQASNLLFSLTQRINRPLYLFVDKLEEPFDRNFYRISGSTAASDGRYNTSIWAYAQLSFAEAVYTFYSGRHHIKIYFGIRQEALIGAEHITRQVTKILSALITKLEYTYEDLQKMFHHYVKVEQPKNLLYPDLADTTPTKALCGVETIRHRSGTEEHMWAYIHRHSLQRPRDIMEMGQALYDGIVRGPEDVKKDNAKLVHTCRKLINTVSTRECMDYITGLSPFMEDDENSDFTKKLLTFLRTLPTNVFTSQTVQLYCHQANKNFNQIACPSCSQCHNFSMLYNIGLLGRIYKSVNGSNYKNSIKPIGDSIFISDKQTLPPASLYYAHPGLGNIIKQEREKMLCTYIPSNFVVNSSEIFVKANQVEMLGHFCAALAGNENKHRVFLASTMDDLKETRNRIASYLKSAGYEVLAFETEDFPSMEVKGDPNREHELGETHDHCIDIMLSCNHIIYLFGGRFGGTYHGKKYQQYVQECSDVIKIRPSVSFVEYLVAKRFDKDIHVYVDEAVDIGRGEWVKNRNLKEYRPHIADDIRVFKQLEFFNTLGNGTWLYKFLDYAKLKSFIMSHFPPVED